MTAATVTYAPGDWVAVVRGELCLLVELAPDDARVPELWAAAETGFEAVLDVLLSRGLRGIGGFALVGWADDGCSYAVRAPARLVFEPAAAEPVRLDAGGRALLSGRVESLPRQAGLSAPDASALRLPIGGGVLPAGALVAVLEPSNPGNDPPAAEPESQVELEPGTVDADQVPTGAGVDASAADAGVSAAGTQAAGTEADGTQADIYYQLLVASTHERDELLAQLHQPEPSPGDPAERPQDRVLDATGVWTDELAEAPLPEPVAPLPEPVAPLPEPETPVADPGAVGAAVPAAQRGGGPAETGIIDGVPWAGAPPQTHAAAASAQPSTAPPPNHIHASTPPISETPPYPPEESEQAYLDAEALSLTYSREALMLELERERELGPQLLALRCAAGHLSPAYAVKCRVCDLELPDQEPEEVDRPALGRLAISSGGMVTLDRGVIFGRAPQSEEQDPARRPHLVRLGESGEISRMHASVTLDGWQVLVRDLGSQNGTFLTLPGREPEQIRPNEDHVLEPGSVISFADVVSAKYEVDA